LTIILNKWDLSFCLHSSSFRNPRFRFLFLSRVSSFLASFMRIIQSSEGTHPFSKRTHPIREANHPCRRQSSILNIRSEGTHPNHPLPWGNSSVPARESIRSEGTHPLREANHPCRRQSSTHPSRRELDQPFLNYIFNILPNQLTKPGHKRIIPPLRMHIYHDLIRKLIVLNFFY